MTLIKGEQVKKNGDVCDDLEVLRFGEQLRGFSDGEQAKNEDVR